MTRRKSDPFDPDIRIDPTRLQRWYVCMYVCMYVCTCVQVTVLKYMYTYESNGRQSIGYIVLSLTL